MDCILLRHGIAVACQDWNGLESERPLTKEGIQKTSKAIAGLKATRRPTHPSPFQPIHTSSSKQPRLLPRRSTLIQNIPTSARNCCFIAAPIELFPVLRDTFSEDVMCHLCWA